MQTQKHLVSEERPRGKLWGEVAPCALRGPGRAAETRRFHLCLAPCAASARYCPFVETGKVKVGGAE